MKQAVELKYVHMYTSCITCNPCLTLGQYSEGMLLSVGHTSGLPDFGKLVKIAFSKVSFITEPYQAWYNEHLPSYELLKKLSSELEIEELEWNHMN